MEVSAVPSIKLTGCLLGLEDKGSIYAYGGHPSKILAKQKGSYITGEFKWFQPVENSTRKGGISKKPN